MKKAVLIHNPTAGDGNHSSGDLKRKIKSAGYKLKYYSTDFPGWEKFTEEKAEVIFVAGGDGTVQKLAKELLRAGGATQKTPVQLIPLGTANNIAVTLGVNEKTEELLNYINKVGLDIGKVNGAGEAEFFIEGIGFGIFPRLVKVMEVIEESEGNLGTPGEALQRSLKELLKIVNEYKAQEAIVIADNEEITGRFLLVELMNIRFIGPNFELAPNAETGDGQFELVLIPEENREDLKKYIFELLQDNNSENRLEEFALLRKVSAVRMKWDGQDVHVDDETIEDFAGGEITVENIQNSLYFRSK